MFERRPSDSRIDLSGLRIRSGFSASAGVLPFLFDASLSTLTPLMAIRAGALFAGAPMVQGKRDGSGTPDLLTAPAGTTILNRFAANSDLYQGSIAVLVTPEWNGNDGIEHNILAQSSDSLRLYKATNSFLRFYIDNGISSADVVNVSAWVAGTTYCVVIRWDTRNTLDGSSYACISVNDVHTYFDTTNNTPNQGPSAWSVGGNVSNLLSASARIEGLTVYRRVLFDGTNGIDVGNGDEINLIYNSGTFKDPCEVTGSWDVVFCLPTNATPGTLATTLQAWSHPHSSNLVTAADGFMTSTAWANWTDIGLPVSEAVLATAEKIFNWGYKFVTTAGGDGEEYTKVVAAGNDWVIRALVHSSDPVDVILYDKSNGSEIGKLTSAGATTRTAPFVAIFTGEAPAGCISLGVRIQGTAVTQTVYCHQVELLANLITNPSFETGAGDPWIPTGWTHNAIDAGESLQDLVVFRSGLSSVLSTAGWAAAERIGILVGAQTAGLFYSIGLFAKVTSGTPQWLSAKYARQRELAVLGATALSTSSSWTHNKLAVRNTSASNTDAIKIDNNGAVANYDDAYIVALTAVTLTVTPASLANSTETSGIRVDGRDLLTQPITAWTATAGIAEWKWTPRHNVADMLKFGNTEPQIIQFLKTATDLIFIRFTGVNTIQLRVTIGGVATNNTWNAVGALVAGTTYTLRLEYNSVSCTLSVDGVIKVTTTPAAGINFGANIPDVVYWGSNTTLGQQIDASYAAPA